MTIEQTSKPKPIMNQGPVPDFVVSDSNDAKVAVREFRSEVVPAVEKPEDREIKQLGKHSMPFVNQELDMRPDPTSPAHRVDTV